MALSGRLTYGYQDRYLIEGNLVILVLRTSRKIIALDGSRQFL